LRRDNRRDADAQRNMKMGLRRVFDMDPRGTGPVPSIMFPFPSVLPFLSSLRLCGILQIKKAAQVSAPGQPFSAQRVPYFLEAMYLRRSTTRFE
jgi:hypothetical protein